MSNSDRQPTATRLEQQDIPSDTTSQDDAEILENLDDVVSTEDELASNESARVDDAITALVFGRDETPQLRHLEEAREFASRADCLVWVDLSEYGEDDLRQAVAAFGLSKTAAGGVIEGWRRPRVMLFTDQFFVNVTVPSVEIAERRIEARELDCFAGETFFVSLHKAPLPFAERIQERAQQSADLVCGDSAFMLFIVLDEVLLAYTCLAEEIENEIERVEERALFENSDTLLDDILELKRFVFAAHRLAEQHREIFVAFLRPDFRWVAGEEVEPYFRDLQAHHSDALSQLAEARSGVNGAFDIYVSQVAHRTNNIVKLLTMVSVILLPMAAIFGLFGTNFETAGLYSEGNFWIMLASVVILALILLGIFRWKRWF